MKVFLSYILTPLFFLFFGLMLALFHPIQIISKNIFGSKVHDKSVFLLNFFLTSCLYILGTRIKFKNFVSLPKNQPILIISNHQSMWDIPPVMWKIRKYIPKYIAKASLAKNIPSISYNLKYGGSVTIDRNDPPGSIKKINEFAKYIKENNYSICIYPEGTRSKDGSVKPFKISGINAILEVIPDILVVPIAIKDTYKIDNGGKFNKNLGVKVQFTMLEGRKIRIDNLEKDLEKIRQDIIAEIK